MKNIFYIFLVLFAVACGKDKYHYNNTEVEVPGPTVEVPVPAPETPLTPIEEVVKDENTFREAGGNTPLVRGLKCTLHVNSNSDLTVAFPSTAHTFTLMGSFDQPNAPITGGNSVIPLSLRSLYINNYTMRCTGYIVIVEAGYQKFTLTSDDGSMLYIGGSLLINNNGNHGAVALSNAKLMNRGIHSFRLDYGQTGGGSQALKLELNDTLVPAETFYR